MTTTTAASSRPWASGSIHVRPDGRFWARLPATHGRRSLGIFATRREAEEVLAAALEQLIAAPLTAPTLDTWGTDWLSTRGVRPTVLERDRDRWRAYIARSELGRLRLGEITELDVARWWKGLRGTRKAALAPQTKLNAAALVRGALGAACAPGGPLSGRQSPAVGLELPRGARARTDPGWTWLRQAELDQVIGCERIPARARAVYAVAAYSGLRAGELWGLGWADVDFERGVIVVRHSRREATKGGQPREVPMLAPVRAALLELHAQPHPRSHVDLVWPARDGGCHHEGHDAGWSEHRKLAGLVRRVRFHDLRHTAASHLLQGTWAPALIARPLRIEEVKEWLGHSDITTTQRYSHLCSDAIAALAVRPDAAAQLVTESQLVTKLVTEASHTADLNCGPTVYERGARASKLRAIGGKTAAVTRSVTSAAIEALELIAMGSPHALLRATEVLERVVLEGASSLGARCTRSPGRHGALDGSATRRG